jgi:SAM-dependent methyltransferase
MTIPDAPGKLTWWRRLSRHSFTRGKISRPILRRFIAAHATNEPTLLLHPEEGVECFPNRFVVSKRTRDNPDLLVDVAFKGLDRVPSESYAMIVCSGLLEHIPDPQRFVDELHRILVPGGRALIACSCCFSIHEGPHDYFHFTRFGIETLFRRWSSFDVLRGSCGPFTTIGILLQRILIQCEVSPPLRPLLEVMVHGFPRLDRFVKRQYATYNMVPGTEIDSMLPSNLQVVAVK